MKSRLIAALAFAFAGTTLTHAADAAPAAPPAPPPAQWERAVSATVVIGADVAVGSDSLVSPSPLLLRVDDPKRLHDVSSKAVECVIDAEAVGNLAAERVMVHLGALRCFDADGGQTTVKNIRGYVVDKDARAGAKGNVLWSQSAKDLILLGAGNETRKNIVMRSAQQALSHATMGIGDDMLVNEHEKSGPPAEVQHNLRSTDSLLPVLTLEPGRTLRLVILGAQ